MISRFIAKYESPSRATANMKATDTHKNIIIDQLSLLLNSHYLKLFSGIAEVLKAKYLCKFRPILA